MEVNADEGGVRDRIRTSEEWRASNKAEKKVQCARESTEFKDRCSLHTTIEGSSRDV